MSQQKPFDPADLTRAVQEVLTVRRVFGEAYERDGVLVVPVAKALGALGTGSGGGEGPSEDSGFGHGGGGGAGLRVRPVGVYEIGPRGVRWHPALDLNRALLGGQVVLAWAVGAWALTRLLRRR